MIPIITNTRIICSFSFSLLIDTDVSSDVLFDQTNVKHINKNTNAVFIFYLYTFIVLNNYFYLNNIFSKAKRTLLKQRYNEYLNETC